MFNPENKAKIVFYSSRETMESLLHPYSQTVMTPHNDEFNKQRQTLFKGLGGRMTSFVIKTLWKMKIWKLKELHVTQSTIAYLFFRFGVSLITVARHKFGSRCRFTESIFRKLDQQKIIPAHVTVILYCSLIQSRHYTSSIC